MLRELMYTDQRYCDVCAQINGGNEVKAEVIDVLLFETKTTS